MRRNYPRATAAPAARLMIRTTFAATAIAAVIFGVASSAAADTPTPTPIPPPGATAQCCDGTYSFSQHRSGTCSHHGGACEWCPCGSAPSITGNGYGVSQAHLVPGTPVSRH
jgi:hypothetical protein